MSSKAGETGLGRMVIWAFVFFGGTLLADVPITSGTFGGSFESQSIGLSDISIQGPSFELNCARLSDSGSGSSGSLHSFVLYPDAAITQPCYNGGLIYNGLAYSIVELNLTFTGKAATVPNSSLLSPVPGSASGQVTNVVFSMTGTVTTFSDKLGGAISNIIPVYGSGVFSGGGIAGYAFGQGSTGAATYQFLALPAFVQDTASRGTWSPDYGGDGFYIANGKSQAAANASVSMPGDISLHLG